MKAKRFTEEKIIAVLKEAEAGAKTKDLCRKYGIWISRSAAVSEVSPLATDASVLVSKLTHVRCGCACGAHVDPASPQMIHWI